MLGGSAANAFPIPVGGVTNTQLQNAACGYANGTFSYTSPFAYYGTNSAGICNPGKFGTNTGDGPWNWTCLGRNGGSTASCSVGLIQDGVCGSSGNSPSTSEPTTSLCSIGTASAVTATDSWNWSCNGVNGGKTTQCSAFIQQAKGFVVPTGPYFSPAARTEQPLLCSNSESYPTQWAWDPNNTTQQPRAATAADGLTPLIQQVRNGVVIATYSSFGSGTGCSVQPNGSYNPQPSADTGCGPFSRTRADIYRLWQSGDTFLVYPAVYTGNTNNIYIAPNVDYYMGPTYVPSNITIQGVTVNGIRPVILDPVPILWDFASGQAPIYIFNGGDNSGASNSSNITIQNLDLAYDTDNGFWGMSGIYINGGTNITLSQMRVHGLELELTNTGGANGIFVTPNNMGTLTLNQIELYQDGGASNALHHNIYVNASAIDPNFTVHMLNSWSHDAFYGHLFKSRAQINILEGNYFQGGLPQGGAYTQAENYLVDIPNGGQLIMRNNVLAKNASGPNSNGAAITFAVEGFDTTRTNSIDIENNTFVAFAATYDGYHPIWPFFFLGGVTTGTSGTTFPGLPSTPVVVSNNSFVGFCPAAGYLGSTSETAAFGEINPDFSFVNPALSYDITQAGTPAYSHVTQSGLTRQVITNGSLQYLPFGAEDQ